MATEQVQWFCANCRCPTLHVRMTQDCPHLVHAIVTLFLCGLWLPIWVIHSVMVDSGNSKLPFLCNRCGQPAGTGGVQSVGHSPFAAPKQLPPAGGWGP